MKNRSRIELLKPLLGVALGFCVAAVPGYCSTVLEFQTTSNSGNISVSGSTLNSFSSVTLNEVEVLSAPDTNDNGYWSITSSNLSWSGGTLTLTGTIGSCISGTCTNNDGNLGGVTGTLEKATISFPHGGSPGFTTGGSSPNYSVNVAFGTGTSISEALANNGSSVNILTLLGLTPSATSSAVTGGVIQGSGSTLSSFTASSETLDVTIAATPEPASFFLLGAGLLGVGWFARRRSVQS